MARLAYTVGQKQYSEPVIKPIFLGYMAFLSRKRHLLVIMLYFYSLNFCEYKKFTK